jgi:hypothetical protein
MASGMPESLARTSALTLSGDLDCCLPGRPWAVRGWPKVTVGTHG